MNPVFLTTEIATTPNPPNHLVRFYFLYFLSPLRLFCKGQVIFAHPLRLRTNPPPFLFFFISIMDAARKAFLSSDESSPKLEALRSKRFLILLDIGNIKTKIKDFPAVAEGQPDANAAEKARLNSALTEANTTLVSIETQISDSEKIILTQKSSFVLPTFGTEDEVSNQHLRLQVPLYDPLLENPSLEDFWKKLCDYGEGLKWSEIAFKKALSNLLQQEAYQLYWIKRSKSLKDILDALQGSFHNYETVFDLQKQLDSCTRQPGQSITNFMNYVHRLLYQTSTLRAEGEIAQAVEAEILRKKLLENASERARNAIFRAQKKALRCGEILSYKLLMDIAKESEHEERTS